MIQIQPELTAESLLPALRNLWSLAGEKILAIERAAKQIGGTPVFTVRGKYVAQGWTEWTQGFQFGAPLLVFDATDDATFLQIGRDHTLHQMAPHVTHFGVHDHGFNQVSTYGNLWRLIGEHRIESEPHEQQLYELALKASGAVQAARWTATDDGEGFIYSFNGPHSLFADTIRSLRALALAWRLGHVLWMENDRQVSLLERLVQHARTTARYNVYYGEGRDTYDLWGRVAHESLFNTNDGRYRCPSTQQGYSPFTTWTRGLAWIMLGYPEQLQFLETVSEDDLQPLGGRAPIQTVLLRAARAACDFYLEQTPTCGVPYWDTGAPGLTQLGHYLDRPADPENDHEPVDSSAAAIAAQGLLRLGSFLRQHGEEPAGRRYWQAGLTVLQTLLQTPYLSQQADHQGLLLHTVYHRPRGWDYVPPGAKTPRGESCMWGDYHLLEAALYVQRAALDQPEHTFFA